MKSSGSPSADVKELTAPLRTRLNPSGVPTHRSPFGAAASENYIARKPIANSQVFHLTEGAPVAGDCIETVATGANPQSACIVLDDCRGRVGGETIPHAESAEALVAQNVEATRFSPHPDIPFAVLHDGEDGGSGKRVRYGETVKLA